MREIPTEDLTYYNWVEKLVLASEQKDKRNFDTAYLAVVNESGRRPKTNPLWINAYYVLTECSLAWANDLPEDFRRRSLSQARKVFDRLPIPNLI